MKRVLLFIVIVAFVSGCEEQKTPRQLFEERASGVVVILNEFYYVMKLPNGNSFFFTGLDQDGDLENLTVDEKEVLRNPKRITGTGFFIDTQGTIMTNRHVAQPQLDKFKAKNAYLELIKSLKALISYSLNQMEEHYEDLNRQRASSIVYDSYAGEYYYDQERINSIDKEKAEIEEEYNELAETYDDINALTDPESLRISVISNIGLAYHNTHVTNRDDFFDKNTCVVTKVSSKEDVDLALIQLKNRRTPSNSYIFDIWNKDEEPVSIVDKVKKLISGNGNKHKELEINQDLYMIGYNAGLTLGNTREGIMAQMTTGKLTQLPDGERLLYSIPTVQGSSGSPVIDADGNFVGVNFAKLNGSDNFNFGIPANKVISFYNE